MRLILFDIDGTLLHCGRQAGQIFLESLEAVFDVLPPWQDYSFAGRTDTKIAVDLLARVGIAAETVHAGLDRMRKTYVSRLEAELDPALMRLLPGVHQLLGRLQSDPQTELGLLTGNFEGGARAKLRHFDLNRYFSFGAFGCDCAARADLVPVALERARESTGARFSRQQVLLVGDTVLDVSCAKTNGCQVLAVATGRTTPEELHAAGADWVVDSLEPCCDHTAFGTGRTGNAAASKAGAVTLP